MLGPDDIEHTVIKRQVGRITLAIVNQVRESNLGREHRSGTAVFVCKVNASHAATKFHGKTSRSPANAATDIKDVFACIETSGTRKFERRCPTPYMKLIDSGQVFRREAV
jgi:hypothetical protein